MARKHPPAEGFGFYAPCALVAALLLWPSLAELLDVPVRVPVLGIFTTGLDYMAVFFHEIGHAVAGWMFGFVSLPTFDFEYGGGMTYHLSDRLWPLQIAWLLALAAGLGYLYKMRALGLLAVAAVLSAFYVFLVFTSWHEAFIVFMGHGGELLVASFCLLRVFAKNTVSLTERYLNMIFGVFVFGRNMILLGGIYFSDIAREAYALQKGREMAGDFDRFADLLNISIHGAVMVGMVVMALLLAGLLGAGLRLSLSAHDDA